MADDPVAVELARLREYMTQTASALVPSLDAAQAYAAGALHGDALKALAGIDAALGHHQPEHLYGNAATEGEPGACPHDPDSALHFEAADGSGEWLCEGKPEGVVCSCTESSDGERVPYPCDEVAGILAALTGKESPVAEAD